MERCRWCESKSQIVVERGAFMVSLVLEDPATHQSYMQIYKGNNATGGFVINYCPNCGRNLLHVT